MAPPPSLIMKTILSLLLLISAVVVLPQDNAQAAVSHAAGEVVGRVVDSNGDGVGDAVVRLRIQTASGRTFEADTRTDRRGRFEFPRVPEGRGVIGAGKRGLGKTRARVGVMAGETTRVKLEL